MRFLYLFIAVLAFSGTSAAQFGVPMSWDVTAEPAAVSAEGFVTLTFRGEIEPGWRLYAMDSSAGRPLRITFEDDIPARSLSDPQQSQPETGFDIHFDSNYTFFTDEVTVTQVFKLDPTATPGTLDFPATVTFMLCNDDVCLPPRTQSLTASVRVSG